jgi:hypothetical protein
VARDEAVLNFSTAGIKRSARRYREGEKVAQEEIRRAMTASAHAGLRVLQEAAPERSGRLKREMRVSRTRGTTTLTAQIESTAEDRGFPYTDVTRRGRRAATAKRESLPSKKLGKIPGTGGRFRRSGSALGPFPNEGGDPIFRRRVSAWRPDVDWVAEAQPAVQAESDRIMSEAADNISTFLSRGFRRTIRVGRR